MLRAAVFREYRLLLLSEFGRGTTRVPFEELGKVRGFLKSEPLRHRGNGQVGVSQQAFCLQIDTSRNERLPVIPTAKTVERVMLFSVHPVFFEYSATRNSCIGCSALPGSTETV